MPVSQALGQEINDGREALAVSDFLLSKLNCLSWAVFSVWWQWQLELVSYHCLVMCIYKYEKKYPYFAPDKKQFSTKNK